MNQHSLRAISNSNHSENIFNIKQKEPSMFEQAETYGQEKANKKFAKSFGLAIFAGVFIAIAFVFYITVTTGGGTAPWGLIRVAGGLAFSLGLILVVVCHGELFTSTVLTSIAWAQKSITTNQLIKCWVRVYFGNMVGAALMVALIVIGGMHQLHGGEWGINAMQIAQHKLHHTWFQAVALGTLCNLLVCLGIWMTFSSKDSMAKSMLLILPVAMFISSGFEHSVANMFMVPLGIMIQSISEPAFFIANGFTQADFADLTWYHFIFNNLIPVTIGNIIGGGLFVGLGYWFIEATKNEPTDQNSFHSRTNYSDHKFQLNLNGEPTIMKTQLQHLTVKNVMNENPIVLSPTTSIYEALGLIADTGNRGAPVTDIDNKLVGFVSEQDILRSLWSEEYELNLKLTVADIMFTDLLTVTPTQSVGELLEFMIVDRDKLFPVNDGGALTSRTFQSYDERLRNSASTRPSMYPVIEEGILKGVITRAHLSLYLVDQIRPAQELKTENVENIESIEMLETVEVA